MFSNYPKHYEGEVGYLNLMEDILVNGEDSDDRTGVGTRKVFHRTLRFDLSEGLPLFTTKKVHFKSVLVELLWFLKGRTDIEYLHKYGVKIWDEWVGADGTIGPSAYGKQWRDFAGYDQIQELIKGLKNNPDSRRHLVSAWNPSELDRMQLPPCHFSFQFIVAGNKLNCLFNMRSSDVFLGLPFNIASYGILTMLLAKEVGLEPGELCYSGCDVHLYKNHFKQAEEQIGRIQHAGKPCELTWVNKPILELEFEDFELKGYNPQPAIKAPVAV